MKYLACNCPHCSQHIEFPEEMASQDLECPTCHGVMALPALLPLQSQNTGLFSNILRKLKEAKDSAVNEARLKKVLFEAVADGVLTKEEINSIQGFLEENGVDASATGKWAADLYSRALQSTNSGNVCELRLDELQRIQSFLGLSDMDVDKHAATLNRLKALVEIRGGKLPVVVNPMNVVLRGGEVVHWVEPGKLWEERVVGRHYEGGTRGVSLRVARGVSLRFGQSRGQLVCDTADVVIATGNLLITSDRLIFQGDAKSFETKFEKILDINTHGDGIRYAETNRQKPRKIQFLSPNGELIMEVLSHLLSGANSTP